MKSFEPMKTIIFLTLALAMFSSSPALAREKSDVIWLKNGDQITCEVEKLEHGKLQVNTDHMGRLIIDWEEVSHIKSDHKFQFEHTSGTRITGIIQEMPEPGTIKLLGGEHTVTFAQENLVRISQIENTFWKQLDGSLTFGYSFTKASDIGQTNFGIRATHRTEARSFTLDASTIITSDGDNENTKRASLGINMLRFRQNRWFNRYSLGFETNDELGLDLRTTVDAGLGRYLIQTNISELSVLGGLAGTAEDRQSSDDPDTEGESSQKNLEGMLGIGYSRFIFDDPEVNLTATWLVYPSITESGRTRSQFDINLRWEMIKDLFWDLSYYNTYDSDPPSGAESSSDYGIITSIGYSY